MKFKNILGLFLALLVPSFASAQAFRQAVLGTGSLYVANGTTTSFVFDASNDAVEQIYQVTEAATVTKVCYSYGLRIGTPPTFKIGIQGVNTSTGRANGTYKTGTGECSNTFTPPASTANDNTIQCVTLTGTTCSVTRGEEIALVLTYSSGTISGANGSSFKQHFNNDQNWRNGTNYGVYVNAGAGTFDAGYENFTMFYGNSSRYWGNVAIDYLQDTFSGTAEQALTFQIPGPVGGTFTLAGAEIFSSGPAAGETMTVSVYTGTTSLASTGALDGDLFADHGNQGTRVYFTTSPTLTFNTTYRIGVVFGATGKFLHKTDVGSANNAYLDAWPLGVNTYVSHRATGGGTAWTDDTGQRAHINPILDTINGSASAPKFHPGMTGFTNG